MVFANIVITLPWGQLRWNWSHWWWNGNYIDNNKHRNRQTKCRHFAQKGFRPGLYLLPPWIQQWEIDWRLAQKQPAAKSSEKTNRQKSQKIKTGTQIWEKLKWIQNLFNKSTLLEYFWNDKFEKFEEEKTRQVEYDHSSEHDRRHQFHHFEWNAPIVVGGKVWQ